MSKNNSLHKNVQFLFIKKLQQVEKKKQKNKLYKMRRKYKMDISKISFVCSSNIKYYDEINRVIGFGKF